MAHTHTLTHTHAHAHTRTSAHTHTYTHTHMHTHTRAHITLTDLTAWMPTRPVPHPNSRQVLPAAATSVSLQLRWSTNFPKRIVIRLHLRYPVPKWLFFLLFPFFFINVGSDFHCLRSFLLFQQDACFLSWSEHCTKSGIQLRQHNRRSLRRT
jgi:hypothetical protein